MPTGATQADTEDLRLVTAMLSNATVRAAGEVGPIAGCYA